MNYFTVQGVGHVKEVQEAGGLGEGITAAKGWEIEVHEFLPYRMDAVNNNDILRIICVEYLLPRGDYGL